MRRTVFLLYKKVVQGSVEGPSPTETRYWGLVGANYVAQLTSYNTGKGFDESPVVDTGLAAAVVEDGELYFATEVDTQATANLKSGGMCSLMYGSTNPQIHHFFKQLQVRCWTATVTGRAELVEAETIWHPFTTNPFLLNKVAQRNRTASLAQASRTRGQYKKTVEVKDEDEEDDTEVLSADGYTIWRLKRENGFLGLPQGGLDKVSVFTVPDLDPLAPQVHKWVTRFNSRRDVLIEGVRATYSVPLNNAFAFHLDKRGVFLMGTTEADPVWQEYFIEWGPDMTFDSITQLKNWWAEFVAHADISHDAKPNDKPDDLTRL